MNEKQWIGIAIAVILLLIMIYICYCNYSCNDYLYGMWEADNEFSKESGLSSLMIMIGPSQGGMINDKRKFYFLMYSEEDEIYNGTVDVNLSPTYTIKGNYQNRKIVIEDDDFKAMPKEMTMSVSIKDGHMVFYGTGDDSDRIYGSLYKDHDATHKAKLMNKMSDESD